MGSQENAKKSNYVIEGASYGYQIATRVATPEWRTVGGQCFVVRKVPGSSSGEPLFDPYLSEEI